MHQMSDSLCVLCCLVAVLGPVSCGLTSINTVYYYIRSATALNNSCPSPCYTLSEYQAMSTDNSTFNDAIIGHDVVMIVLPGEHVLDGAFIVVGAKTFTMTCSEQSSGMCSIETIRGTIQISSVDEIRFSWLSYTTYHQVRIKTIFFVRPNAFQTIAITDCTVVGFNRNFLSAERGNVTIQNTTLSHNQLLDQNLNSLYLIFVNYGSLHFVNNTLMYNNITRSSLIYTFETNLLLEDNVIMENIGFDCRLPLVYTLFGKVTLMKRNIFSHNQHTLWFVLSGDVLVEGSVEFSSNSACGGPLTLLGRSTLYFSGNATFVNNSASIFGGAIILSSGSTMNILHNANVLLERNTALNRGGAIYVDDSRECVYVGDRECFLKTPEDVNYSLTFQNNNAQIAGDDIYGGQIETCISGLDSVIRTSGLITRYHDQPTLSSIASDPTQICLCSTDKILCCPSGGSNVDGVAIETCPSVNVAQEVFPGENVTLHLLAVGQYFGVVPSGILVFNGNAYTDINVPLFKQEISEGMSISDRTRTACTSVTYFPNYPVGDFEFISLYPSGVCLLQNALAIQIKVSAVCPPGFDMSEGSQVCVCEERLQQFRSVSCDITLQTIEHDGDIWVGYHNTSNNNSGLIIHSSPCPFDYCIRDYVSFALNNTDLQCDHNRSGLLCGQCEMGLSVVLGGTSECRECSNGYLALLIPFSLAGLALLVVLFLLRFTVNYGTLNGLLFYANIMQVNRTIFFPTGDTNILTVFIAWMNLDLGIETCFYNGMDAYGKTWLQFVFPLYIWALLGLIIVFSSRSRRITKFIGSNPIAVLATLFLISYLKIFRTIIAVFSATTLEYPDSDARSVWVLDGNVTFRSGRHLFLFLFALIVFVLLFIPYTILLISGQWLLSFSHLKPLSWANSPRLRTLLDTYHAPYKDRHRYWTGLLLLFRLALAIGNAFTIAYNKSFSSQIFIISSSIVAVVFLCITWGWTVKGLYKHWTLDLLEGSFLINLGLLSYVVSHYKTNGGDQTAAVSASMSIAFVTFLGIVSYHVYLTLKTSELLRDYLQQVKTTISSTREIKVATDQAPATNQLPLPPTSFVQLRESLLEDEAVL